MAILDDGSLTRKLVDSEGTVTIAEAGITTNKLDTS